MTQLTPTQLQFQYWCKYHDSTDCWKWIGEVDRHKPRFTTDHRKMDARRWAIEHGGRIAGPGTRYYHRSGPRTSPCVNPHHWIEHSSTGDFSGPTFYDCLSDLDGHRLRLGEITTIPEEDLQNVSSEEFRNITAATIDFQIRQAR